MAIHAIPQLTIRNTRLNYRIVATLLATLLYLRMSAEKYLHLRCAPVTKTYRKGKSNRR